MTQDLIFSREVLFCLVILLAWNSPSFSVFVMLLVGCWMEHAVGGWGWVFSHCHWFFVNSIKACIRMFLNTRVESITTETCRKENKACGLMFLCSYVSASWLYADVLMKLGGHACFSTLFIVLKFSRVQCLCEKKKWIYCICHKV